MPGMLQFCARPIRPGDTHGQSREQDRITATHIACQGGCNRARDADAAAAGGAAVRSLARQLHSWTGTLLGGVGTAADMSLALAAASVQRPGPKAAVAKAAALVRDAREAAGLTLDDLGAALDLKDPTFMALVESGKVGLPFEMILRLATILGRNDPITFILQLTRSYNPRVWKSLEALGVGKLLVQAGREREFANIYRSNTARAAVVRRATSPRRWPSRPRPSKVRWSSWATRRSPTRSRRSRPKPPPEAVYRSHPVHAAACRRVAIDLQQGRSSSGVRRCA